MLYLERNFGSEVGWVRVFSTTDSAKELNKFRCLVRAPVQAIHQQKNKEDRTYLLLFGAPRDRAVMMIRQDLLFETPVERMVWEKEQPEVFKRHPTPFTGVEDAGS